MNFLENMLGGGQGQQDFQNFVSRYEQGQPQDGYSGQEAMDRYQQVATQLPHQNYVQAAEAAFGRMSPQQRGEFGQLLQQQAQQSNIPLPGLGASQGAAGGQMQDPGILASVVGSLHQQDPNLLSQLLGGGSGSSGGSGGNLLGNPAVRSALGGIAAMAAKQFFGQRH